MTGTAADVRHDYRSGMTVERALAVAECRAEGSCVPPCPHCAASPAEVEAARAWLDEHPDEQEAWAVGRLASIMGVLRHWTAMPAASDSGAGPWKITAGGTLVVGDLTQELAEVIVQQHNRQVSAALGIIDWYLGGD